MLNCSETITIYNKFVENGCECWKRTAISGVSWFGKQQTDVSTEGFSSVDMAIVRIPESVAQDYRPSQQWMVERTGWTLREGDVIVRGAFDLEVTQGESVSKVLTSAEQTVTVQSVGDNRRGGLSHIRVSGGVKNANGR